jgi:hypothetical protein
MKPSGDTWRMDEAPKPAHVQDFAELAAAVARRYRDVTYFQVWNELKGLGWDAARYTDLYNWVWDAVKRVRPDARLGGPYVIMASYANSTHPADEPDLRDQSWGSIDQRALDVITYWRSNKRGADFVIVAGCAADAGDDDIFARIEKFAAVNAWLGRAVPGLPIWWAEDYTFLPLDAKPSDQLQAATLATMLVRHVQTGTSKSLR